MYKCDFCKRDSRPGESLILVPTSVPFAHPERREANDPGGIGSRIVSEAKRCPRCKAVPHV